MNGTEVKLTLTQVQRYQTCQALLEGRLTTAEAAQALGLSPRQVQRLKARLQADGPQALVHGNTARSPANKTPAALKQQVLDLATTTYRRHHPECRGDIPPAGAECTGIPDGLLPGSAGQCPRPFAAAATALLLTPGPYELAR
jgi:hypothetical protein